MLNRRGRKKEYGKKGENAENKPIHEDLIGYTEQRILPVKHLTLVIDIDHHGMVDRFPGIDQVVHFIHIIIKRLVRNCSKKKGGLCAISNSHYPAFYSG
jgi:hypothetical protein